MITNADGSVTLTREEYVELKRDALLLESLQNQGVDNWGGYGDHYGDYMDMLISEGLATDEEIEEYNEEV